MCVCAAVEHRQLVGTLLTRLVGRGSVTAEVWEQCAKFHLSSTDLLDHMKVGVCLCLCVLYDWCGVVCEVSVYVCYMTGVCVCVSVYVCYMTGVVCVCLCLCVLYDWCGVCVSLFMCVI